MWVMQAIFIVPAKNEKTWKMFDSVYLIRHSFCFFWLDAALLFDVFFHHGPRFWPRVAGLLSKGIAV